MKCLSAYVQIIYSSKTHLQPILNRDDQRKNDIDVLQLEATQGPRVQRARPRFSSLVLARREAGRVRDDGEARSPRSHSHANDTTSTTAMFYTRRYLPRSPRLIMPLCLSFLPQKAIALAVLHAAAAFCCFCCESPRTSLLFSPSYAPAPAAVGPLWEAPPPPALALPCRRPLLTRR